MGKFNKARQQFGFLNAWTVFLADGSQNPRTFFSQKIYWLTLSYGI